MSEETRDALLISLMIFLALLSVFLGVIIVASFHAAVNIEAGVREFVRFVVHHPDAFEAILDGTDNATWFGCVHWAEDFSKRLGEEFGIDDKLVFDMVWFLGFCMGRIVDCPDFKDAGSFPVLVVVAFFVSAFTMGFVFGWTFKKLRGSRNEAGDRPGGGEV